MCAEAALTQIAACVVPIQGKHRSQCHPRSRCRCSLQDHQEAKLPPVEYVVQMSGVVCRQSTEGTRHLSDSTPVGEALSIGGRSVPFRSVESLLQLTVNVLGQPQ